MGAYTHNIEIKIYLGQPQPRRNRRGMDAAAARSGDVTRGGACADA